MTQQPFMIPMRAFVITLPENPERIERARQHLRERGVDFYLFNGIHGEKFGLRTVFPYDVDNPGGNYFIRFKSIGNILSHYMLWGALNLLHDDMYMILEDDAQFPEDWHARVVAALRDVPPDFDMLYIGSCCCSGKPQTHTKGDVISVSPLCTHAYIVAKKALPVLLKTQRKVYAPVDIAISLHAHPYLKVFAVLPRIVDQFDTVLAP